MRNNQGQTLVTLLVFMMIALMVISAAVVILIINATTTTKFQESLRALLVAESGAENAILRLLRNPSYAGETLSVDDGTATVAVVGASPIIVTSEGRVGNFLRKVQITANYSGNILSIVSWREVP